MIQIIIINGPNLNLLGRRQPELYGNVSFEEYFVELEKEFKDINLHYYQSNHEGDILDKLHAVGFRYDGIILNAGGYTHTSVAIADAIRAITSPVIEVHLTNIYEREQYRHNNYIKDAVEHAIIGKGLGGYREAIIYLKDNFINKSI
ncbi:MAG TPA: type II 3-dehydroquinate dehydratase [Saprospiraceae bacterium]|jgi:3-dehydroquinate dehydratase-2|nr:3-dehydroquinate dehydratase [Saprospiraceae bacterium]HRO08224.1 type II 3-dehydroquinate dehydratase [Saprospiraceae bacterium]HRO72396.1 type II 3-dehydroquinate dehydratase [Saprospiraceae bacterium]HRP41115.1 type II 3-dehydroquinate dehydratase [Saprospiraceae bacterium]